MQISRAMTNALIVASGVTVNLEASAIGSAVLVAGVEPALGGL
jgi:hypothetical protein